MLFKGAQVEFSKLCISVPEGCFYLANSAGPDEMQHNAAFHLGLHFCQSNCLGVSSIQWVNTVLSIRSAIAH